MTSKKLGFRVLAFLIGFEWKENKEKIYRVWRVCVLFQELTHESKRRLPGCVGVILAMACLRTNNLTVIPVGVCVPNCKIKHQETGRHISRSSGSDLNTKEGFNSRGSFFGGGKQRPLEWQEEVSRVHRGLELAFPRFRRDRDVTTNVIPFERERPRSLPPPDLTSYFMSKRIIYLGYPLYWSVFELLVAELLHLEQADPDKPVYLYINSTGCIKNGIKYGEVDQAIALHDIMRSASYPIYTLCCGVAWGEAALLLAAGAKGNRAALPSASIMTREPITMFQGQATDMDIACTEIAYNKELMVRLLARYTQHSKEKIAHDIRHPKYFSPQEAVEYGLIDKVLYTKGREGSGVSQLKRADLI